MAAGTEVSESLTCDDGAKRRPAQVHVRLLGGFAFIVDGSFVPLPSNIQRVIAFLTIRDRPQNRLTISSTLWMDTSAERAAANLRQSLWKGRHLLGGCIEVNGNHLALAPTVDIDIRRVGSQVRRLLAEGSTLLDEDRDMVDLAGDLLPDWDEEWIVFERERFRQMRIHALESLSRKLSQSGRAGEAIDAGLAAVAAEPLRESGQWALIAAHLGEGNVSEARRQYHQYRELLWDALGVEPSATLRALVWSTAESR